jgi:hypothetical protein
MDTLETICEALRDLRRRLELLEREIQTQGAQTKQIALNLKERYADV